MFKPPEQDGGDDTDRIGQKSKWGIDEKKMAFAKFDGRKVSLHQMHDCMMLMHKFWSACVSCKLGNIWALCYHSGFLKQAVNCSMCLINWGICFFIDCLSCHCCQVNAIQVEQATKATQATDKEIQFDYTVSTVITASLCVVGSIWALCFLEGDLKHPMCCAFTTAKFTR